MLEKVGEIKLGESGFSTICNEQKALEILQREGCSAGADLIYIFEEQRPDAWSSCYRCRAEFYKNTEPQIILESDEIYKPGYVTQRVAHDKKNNTAMIIFGVAAGFVIGFLAF